MVLHHVAHRAIFVVIGPAVFHADGFGDGDLHMLDAGLVPQRLEQRVGEAQRDQVLHRLLAEIMVDAEDAVFAERLRQRVVDRAAAREIAPDRLLDDDAAVACASPTLFQIAADRAVMAGRGRQIKDAAPDASPTRFAQIGECFRCGRVDGDMAEAAPKAPPGFVGNRRRAGPHRFLDLLCEFLVAQFSPGAADDFEIGVGQQAVFVEKIKRRKQHALGEVACGPENQDSLCGHVAGLRFRVRQFERAICAEVGA